MQFYVGHWNLKQQVSVQVMDSQLEFIWGKQELFCEARHSVPLALDSWAKACAELSQS